MNFAKIVVVAGLGITAIGLVLVLLARFDIVPGRLPGDITWRGRNTTLYFPIVTCIVLSVLGTLLMWLLNKR